MRSRFRCPRQCRDIVEGRQHRRGPGIAGTLWENGGCGASLRRLSSPISLHRLFLALRPDHAKASSARPHYDLDRLLPPIMHRFLSPSDESADLTRRPTQVRTDDLGAAVENLCIIRAKNAVSHRRLNEGGVGENRGHPGVLTFINPQTLPYL